MNEDIQKSQLLRKSTTRRNMKLKHKLNLRYIRDMILCNRKIFLFVILMNKKKLKSVQQFGTFEGL